MFCKITRSKVSPDNMGQLAQWVKEKWGPLISSQEGFKRGYFITKLNGEFTLIMLWETEEEIQSWTDNPEHKKLLPEFMSLKTGSVDMDVYDVQDIIGF
jgi:heme-degrading monooxygenase HmoA